MFKSKFINKFFLNNNNKIYILYIKPARGFAIKIPGKNIWPEPGIEPWNSCVPDKRVDDYTIQIEVVVQVNFLNIGNWNS